jgi:hypothetical protein
MLRVQQNAQKALKERQHNMSENNVELLAFVSKALRMRIHFEIYRPIFSMHTFFDLFCNESPHVMRQVCHEAVKVMAVVRGDVLFYSGEMPGHPKTYIVQGGKLLYRRDAEQKTNVGANAWVSEAVLWQEWMHCGTLMATTDSRLLAIDAKKFQSICIQFDYPGPVDPTFYAVQFVEDLNKAAPEDISDLFHTRFSVQPNTGRHGGHFGHGKEKKEKFGATVTLDASQDVGSTSSRRESTRRASTASRRQAIRQSVSTIPDALRRVSTSARRVSFFT